MSRSRKFEGQNLTGRTSISLDPAALERLRAFSRSTGISASFVLRRGLTLALDEYDTLQIPAAKKSGQAVGDDGPQARSRTRGGGES